MSENGSVTPAPDSPIARTRRRRGRPKDRAVTRDGIAAAALAVARTEGYERLTMAAVARLLGVAPSALYNHISGKEELFVMLQDAVMVDVSVAELHGAARGEVPVVDALRAWARSYRAAFAAHPPLIPVIATLPIAGAERTQAVYEAVCAALTRTSLPKPAVLPRVIALESFIYGSAYDVHAPEDIFDVSDVPAGVESLDAAVRSFHASEPLRGDSPNPYADAPFEAGLDLLLADLEDASAASDGAAAAS